MPLRLADLARETKATALDWEGETITMQVRHTLITPRFLADVDDLQDLTEHGGAKIVAICEHLARVIASWDILDADGVSPFPVDAARMAAEMPAPLVGALLEAVTGVMSGGKSSAPGENGSANGRPSGATSKARAG